MKQFFKEFFQGYQRKIIGFSFLRVFSLVQELFWPYAFSRIINKMSENPENWRTAVIWAGVMILNKILEDFIRLKAKFELEKIGTKLEISLATFFSEKTEIRNGKKTGESVQAIKKASEDIYSLIEFYKDNLLRLPVNLIIIPFILFRANTSYLIFLIIYGALYLGIDYFALNLYQKKLKKYFKAAEVFWGTTYRKAPEVWRQREDGYVFAEEVDHQGESLYQKTVSADNIERWRWSALQAFSSASIGAVILFVLYRIINNTTPVGDLILVAGYFEEMQGTLNIFTSALTQVIHTKISLKRLSRAVKIK